MGKLVVSLDGVVIKDVQLTKDKTTLGRRPYNDIVIDNLAVSGEHALLQMVGSEVFIEDLNSTNGTYINGKAIRRQLLQHNDTIEVGKYKIRFLSDEGGEVERTSVQRPTTPAALGDLPRPVTGAVSRPSPLTASSTVSPPPTATVTGFAPMPGGRALIRVLDGPAAGREVTLVKEVTTVGKPGVQVAAISRTPSGYTFAHVDGVSRPSINGQPVSADPVMLNDGDVIDLAGTKMQFVRA